jgi:SAM-dependent methyltransferase
VPGPDAAFWNERFARGDTPWDRGGAGPQLLAWLDGGVVAPGCRIAVPGCGRGWEVAELARRGFEVTGIDVAREACVRARDALAQQGLRAEIVDADVCAWRPARPFDAVYEQTCLCAMHPTAWRAYESALADWLRPAGTLLAMFAQRPRPEAVEAGIIEGPPYHCDVNAMRMLFDDARWEWPAPPYARVPHPNGMHELGLVLRRR